MLDAVLIAARVVQLVAVLSVFGALVFRAVVAPFPVRRVLVPALVAVAVSAAIWLGLEAAQLTDAANVAGALAAVPPALLSTRFGHDLLLRLGFVALAAAVAGSGDRRDRAGVAAIPAAAGVGVMAFAGHAGATGDPVAIAASVLHMLAAGAWLGGLIPLRLAMDADHGKQAAQVARRFSIVGMISVPILAGTAFWQARELIGGLAGLAGTDYGNVALVKAGLFAVLIGLAVIHRWVLTPALGDRAGNALRVMRWTLLSETALGLCVVAAAGTLATLLPAEHDQPEWPFPLRPSLVALAEPEIRRELATAAMALGVALMLFVLGIVSRRFRWPALAGAFLIGWYAVPHLRPLLVEAYPTSFYASPTGFDSGSIADGRTLFAANCVTCHGTDGRGDGPEASALAIPPADLTADHLWDHSDGELFWWLTHGMESPEGGLAMPGFMSALHPDQRWALIDYIRAHNSGVSRRALGSWFRPTLAPGFQAMCGAGDASSLEDLRGRPVRIVVGPPDRAVPVADGMATIFLAKEDPGAGQCVAQAPEVIDAYAIVTGMRPAQLAGAWFLVDPQGWLRAFHRPDGGEPAAIALGAEIDAMLAHPIDATSGGTHVHHH